MEHGFKGAVTLEHMLIVDFDGINLGVRGNFAETWLEFESLQEAFELAQHWEAWIGGFNV